MCLHKMFAVGEISPLYHNSQQLNKLDTTYVPPYFFPTSSRLKHIKSSDKTTFQSHHHIMRDSEIYIEDNYSSVEGQFDSQTKRYMYSTNKG